MVVGIAAPIGDKQCLEVAMPPFPFSDRSNCLAATQLSPENGKERQLHRRAQAREFGGSKSTKRYGPGIVVTHDAVSWLDSNRRSAAAGAPCEIKNPR